MQGSIRYVSDSFTNEQKKIEFSCALLARHIFKYNMMLQCRDKLTRINGMRLANIWCSYSKCALVGEMEYPFVDGGHARFE